MTEITAFAQTNFRNQATAFGIKTDDRRRHLYAIGKTGMGKTNMLENLAIQDIRNGHGVCFVDPHGDTAEKLISMIPPERINDVIYFNPADQDFPIAFNVLEEVPREFRPLVASGLIGVFQKLWADSWGPRLEYILRNAILALLCHPSSTLLGINRLLVDKQYREEVLSYVDDPVVSAFWIDEFSKYNDRLLTEAISPIQNKVGQFLSSGLIRNIVGQTESSFNIRKAMDEGKILIMNLSKGHIGEDSSALLGAMMITKVQLAAMSRVDTPEEERRDFYLYVDEFQNFATESFAGILSEARKYRLNLILAHQFMAQLDETVLNAVLGNVGTIVSFRVGALDTEILEKEFEPTFYANDLVNLDKYNIYLKLMIDGVATRPFSAQTLLPIDISKTEKSVDRVIEASRKAYAHSKEEVEQAIMDWSGMKNPETVQNIKAFAQQGGGGNKNQTEKKQMPSKSNQLENKQTRQNNFKKQGQRKKIEKSAISDGEMIKNNTKNNRQEFNNDLGIGGLSSVKNQEITVVNCSGCQKETEINFVPDGVRPVFCQDCLKEYRREQSKLQQTKIGASTKGENKSSDNKHGQDKKYHKHDDTQNKIVQSKKAIKVVNNKKAIRKKIDSDVVQNLIKDAMEK